MGKKSRRKQGTLKGATSLMEANDEAEAAKHTLSTFEKLVRSGQMEKALHLESKVLNAIKVRPGGTYSIYLSSIYRGLGDVYRSGVTKPEGCDKAISYYQKSQESTTDIDRDTTYGERQIIGCYLDFDRCDEAVGVFKEAVSRLKEYHPSGTQGYGLFVLYVAGELHQRKAHKYVFEILDLVSDDINTCWDLDHQNMAYRYLAESALKQNELQNGIAYYHKMLSVVRKQKDKSYEALISGTIGELYRRCCKYRTAMKHFQNALAIQKTLKTKDSRQLVMDVYIKMGWTYLSRGAGNEQNALKVFGKILSKAHSSGAENSTLLVRAFKGMGLAYYDLGKWNHAIEAFNKILHECTKLMIGEKTQAQAQVQAHVYLGNAYIEKYRTLPLNVGLEERISLLKNAENHIDELSVLVANRPRNGDIQYSIAKVYCLLDGRRDTAKRVIGEILDSEIDRCCYGDIVYCDCCRRRDGEIVQLLVCAGCRVKCYCNRKHQKKKWRGRFMDHRTLCPFLNRWRRVKRRTKKGKSTRGDSLECIKNDFVDMIECKYTNDRNGSDLVEID
jgi:tetratricopeptide (TPR) repeat protein